MIHKPFMNKICSQQMLQSQHEIESHRNRIEQKRITRLTSLNNVRNTNKLIMIEHRNDTHHTQGPPDPILVNSSLTFVAKSLEPFVAAPSPTLSPTDSDTIVPATFASPSRRTLFSSVGIASVLFCIWAN